MTADEKELYDVLFKYGYAVVVDNKPVLTKKFNDLFPKPATQVLAPTLETFIYKPLTGFANDIKSIWNQFISDAEIPHRVNATSGGQYTVRQFSKPAADRLYKIVHDPVVDYNILVASTKNYYKTVTYKILLSKYLINDVWKDEYAYYQNKGERKQLNQGENRFED